ncbi:hypothetical protein EV196_10242 [Mariniflexile fucanivorans]|uniref:Uncharacterized protein n=1 Tax=Mariniflexile fucanivorans TaxID=264023 RepID=A0A4R1RMR2_9FLAO|nr:hypothetical protein [Mariniflexile fucanivorans]TCL67486.1 hypothetical protein EV196_10242 [Mariniflexile fucanivorans]
MENYRFKETRIDRVFSTAESANDYYDFLIKSGYKNDDITVIMSEKTKEIFYATNEHVSNTGEDALKGAGAGVAIGGSVGAVVGAVVAIGTSIIIPGLGIAIAGPIAGALIGAGAGGTGGAIIGALTNAGLSNSVATEYKDAMDKGHIIISVEPKDRHDIVLSKTYGTEIYNGYNMR